MTRRFVVRISNFAGTSVSRSSLVLVLLALGVVTLTACNGSRRGAQRGKGEDLTSPYLPKTQGQPLFQPVKLASLQVPLPHVPDAEYVNDDTLCMVCHDTYAKTFAHNVHRGQSCEKCHGPASRHLITRGKEPGTLLNFKRMTPPERSEVCLQCHEQNQCEPGSAWRTSVHAHHGVACTDCHTSHYNVPPGTPPTSLDMARDDRPIQQLVSLIRQQPEPQLDQESIREASNNLGAITTQVCYRCHSSMQQYEQIAHPHQILGSNGFTCATCHDPHGKIRQETRTDLCLKCHDQSSPTMAWHSGTHFRYGVACTDCHNPHPNPNVQRAMNIQHTNISRPKRLPMSVDEPQACYKCHADIYAHNAMPSHHPIKEGKMVCSDCHDPHGQTQGNLTQPTVNMVCWRCHAEKQGPFAYEHPPVTENCGICHDPHGTVANNLLKQPTTFLCLRCHTGHRTGPTFGPHTGAGLVDVGTNANLQRAFYTDCTQCHSQIHGSDLPSPHLPKAFLR
jgi:DmsE family decaheme c-type cytochrome